MSIEGKHSYRFGYLKSEQWETVRLEALAREKGKCQICGEESIHNDAHHMWYPENAYETTERHLVILCRPCHNFIHAMLPECKTNDEESGRKMWCDFSNAIFAWRAQKVFLFDDQQIEALEASMKGAAGIKALRNQYVLLAKDSKRKDLLIKAYEQQHGIVHLTTARERLEKQVPEILDTIKKWSEIYTHYVRQGKIDVAQSDYEI